LLAIVVLHCGKSSRLARTGGAGCLILGGGIIGQLEVGFMQNRQKSRLSFTTFIGFGRGV
jgi:hypothetical protein